MVTKFELEGQEYEVSELTDEGKKNLMSLQFATNRLKELNNMRALLERARNSYMSALKKEMLSSKSGLFLE